MSDLFDRAARLIRPVASILDIGAGIRPQPFFKAASHLCIEPHDEYADWLELHGYDVERTTAVDWLSSCRPVDSVFFLDVIEHMEKSEGMAALTMARTIAREQVIVFTPLGFIEQSYQPGDKDRWGMTGGKWQTHRSGWRPDEFPEAATLVDPTFHDPHGGAFFAIFGA